MRRAPSAPRFAGAVALRDGLCPMLLSHGPGRSSTPPAAIPWPRPRQPPRAGWRPCDPRRCARASFWHWPPAVPARQPPDLAPSGLRRQAPLHPRPAAARAAARPRPARPLQPDNAPKAADTEPRSHQPCCAAEYRAVRYRQSHRPAQRLPRPCGWCPGQCRRRRWGEMDAWDEARTRKTVSPIVTRAGCPNRLPG